MVQFTFLNGQTAGGETAVRRFPFSIGRSGSDCVFEETGVWDRHCEIVLKKDGVYVRRTNEGAVLVNDESIDERCLRGGDVLTLGSVRLRYELAPAVQSRTLLGPLAVALLVGAVLCVQAVLMARFL